MMAATIGILYVDDEPDLLDIGKEFLEKSVDFTVTTALSATEAIRLLEQEKFDAIISDYQMPGMDGIRFSVQESGDDHIIVCEDDGDGVVTQEKEKIFEREFGKNTGLGLSLARDILDITGITIKETGVPGKGARFEIRVPKGAFRQDAGMP